VGDTATLLKDIFQTNKVYFGFVLLFAMTHSQIKTSTLRQICSQISFIFASKFGEELMFKFVNESWWTEEQIQNKLYLPEKCLSAMGLYHPLDGITNLEYNLMCFLTPNKIILDVISTAKH
jgi:hypothetical protein